MYVLTNTSKINGANALVQEELLAQVGDWFKGRLLLFFRLLFMKVATRFADIN